ncbi:hypothetical protein LVJ94_18035 [Pendulispora rubella]|uniref:Tetratricopeptide repeat protein n=1 Tax=Pendulispora rubella TaxID=2741070 RepID=A0ABZ2LH68_9BACT
MALSSSVVAFAVVALHAQAVGSVRPQECGAIEGSQSGNVWERAKTPELRKYCDLLASGASKLAGMQTRGAVAAVASEVIAIANEADTLVPKHSAPAVLRGRAYARLGRWLEAYKEMNEARIRDPRALDDPVALLTWARVTVRAGHADEGDIAYRMLLPRAAMLPLAERGPAYVEAGFVAMSRGPAGLDEAISVFRQARRDAQDTAQAVAILGLALALDRMGAREEARAVLLERQLVNPWPTLSDARARQLLVGPGAERETDALAAIALEVSDPAKAKASWQKYAETAGSSPWMAHARTRAHEPVKRVPGWNVEKTAEKKPR